jgi:hypothetical protein
VATHTYIVAIRRDCRHDAPTDWVERLNRVDGVSVIGASDRRAQIAADDCAVERVREDLGAFALVEPVIEHRPS